MLQVLLVQVVTPPGRWSEGWALSGTRVASMLVGLAASRLGLRSLFAFAFVLGLGGGVGGGVGSLSTMLGLVQVDHVSARGFFGDLLTVGCWLPRGTSLAPVRGVACVLPLVCRRVAGEAGAADASAALRLGRLLESGVGLGLRLRLEAGDAGVAPRVSAAAYDVCTRLPCPSGLGSGGESSSW